MGKLAFLSISSHDKKMFSRERTPLEILQGMIILTRKILKKGFRRSELLECCATYWNKPTSYPPILIDSNILEVFKITVPLITDTLIRTRYLNIYKEKNQADGRIGITK